MRAARRSIPPTTNSRAFHSILACFFFLTNTSMFGFLLLSACTASENQANAGQAPAVQHASVWLLVSVVHGCAEKLFGCSVYDLVHTGTSSSSSRTCTPWAWPRRKTNLIFVSREPGQLRALASREHGPGDGAGHPNNNPKLHHGSLAHPKAGNQTGYTCMRPCTAARSTHCPACKRFVARHAFTAVGIPKQYCLVLATKPKKAA
jgi:hypothetical protein